MIKWLLVATKWERESEWERGVILLLINVLIKIFIVAFPFTSPPIHLPWETFFVSFKLSLLFFSSPFPPQDCLVISPLELFTSQLCQIPDILNCAPLSLSRSSHKKDSFLNFSLIFSKGWLLSLLLKNNSMHEKWVGLVINE